MGHEIEGPPEEWEFDIPSKYDGHYGNCYRGIVSDLQIDETETHFVLKTNEKAHATPINVILRGLWHESIIEDKVLKDGEEAQLVSKNPIDESAILDSTTPILLVTHPEQMMTGLDIVNQSLIKI